MFSLRLCCPCRCRFARRDPNPSEFPESLAPINLSAVKLSCEDLIWNVERGERKAAGGSISPSTGNTGNVLSSSSNSLGTGTGNPGRDRDDGRSPRAAMDRSRSAGRSQRESKSGRPRKPQTKEGALHIGNLKVTRVKLKLSVFDDPLRKPYQHLIEDTIKLSPAYLVSLDAESRLLAGVPLKAQKFVFCYGAKSTLDTAHKKARAKGQSHPTPPHPNPARPLLRHSTRRRHHLICPRLPCGCELG